MDKAQKEVLQAQLNREKELIADLKQVFKQAQEDVMNKITDLSKRQDLENLQTNIYQMQYQDVLRQQIDTVLDQLQTNEYTRIEQYRADCYTDGYTGGMYNIAKSSGIPCIAPIDVKSVEKAIKIDSKLSKSLYKSLDMSELKKSVRMNVSRGILNGSSWNDIGREIGRTMKGTPFQKAMNNGIRIARTEGHRIQVAASLDAMQTAKERGADVVKQWDATLDESTREIHRELDGQIREVDDDFEYSGGTVKAPGMFGDPAEDCNCRCAVLTRARWALDEEELKTLQERAEYFGLDKTKNFEDFREKYLNAVDKAVTINIKTGEDANDFFYRQNQYKEWEKSLNNSEKEAIKEYSQCDYQSINYYLRTDNKKDANILLDEKLYGNKRKEQIRSIDDALSKFNLTNNITVYRNVDAEIYEEYFDDTQSMVGKIFKEKGYTSTSVIKTGAMTNKDCKIEISIPAGKGRGAYINKLSTYEDTEYEFLIARNSKFKVVGVSETEDDLVLKMEMIVNE